MSEFGVQAYFLKKKIAIKELIQSRNQYDILKKESSFVLFQIEENSWLYVKSFGVVVFFNVSKEVRNSELEKLSDGNADLIVDQIESTKVITGVAELKINFDEICVPELDVESVHIICLNLAQSVALFHYQSLAEKLLENTKKHTTELEFKGKFLLKRRKLLRYIGASLNLKNRISENIYIFDTPMLAWEDEKINLLDKQLNEEWETKIRYNGIKENLSIIRENLDMFKDISLHKHSSFLEWIIILLILFEILHLLFAKLF